MANEIFAQILGVVASVSLIISALSVHRMRLLVFSLATAVLVAAQIALVGGTLSTLIICIMGIVRTLFVLIGDVKFAVLRHWGFAAMFMVLYIAVFFTTNDISSLAWFNWMPLFGALAGTLALFFRNMALTKFMFIIAGSLWISYYLNASMMTQIIGEGFTAIANIVALVMVLRAQRAGIKEDDMVDIDDIVVGAITEAIPVVTGRIKAVTTSIKVIKTDTKPVKTI